MKLARKISLVIALGICLVLVVDGLIRIERQLSIFDADMKRDHAAMSRVLQASLQAEWENGSRESAVGLLARIKKRLVRVELSWLSPTDPAVPKDSSEFTTLETSDESIRFVTKRVEGKTYMATLFPLEIEGLPEAVIEMRESTEPRERYVRRTIVRSGITTGVLLAICVGIIFILGHFFIGKPIRKLTHMAGQIALGKHHQDVTIEHSDEIAELGVTMNNMSLEIEKAKERIEAESAARVATLEQLRHADRLKTVGQLTSGIVHELGTPLMVAAGRAKLIAEDELPADQVADSARIVIEQIERVTSTIRQVLDFARKSEPQRQLVDLHAVASQMVSLLTPFATKRNVYLEYECATTQSKASLAQGHLEQVLTNLVINALHATGPGGKVVVLLNDEQPLEKTQTYACLNVLDNGSGITDEHFERIFEPFYTTKGAGEGSGLGLSIANELIKEAGGEINVTTAEGTGTSFRVYIPVIGEDDEN